MEHSDKISGERSCQPCTLLASLQILFVYYFFQAFKINLCINTFDYISLEKGNKTIYDAFHCVCVSKKNTDISHACRTQHLVTSYFSQLLKFLGGATRAVKSSGGSEIILNG